MSRGNSAIAPLGSLLSLVNGANIERRGRREWSSLLSFHDLGLFFQVSANGSLNSFIADRPRFELQYPIVDH